MRDAFSLIWLALIGLFRSRASLQAESLTLRHQLNVLRRKSPQRLGFTSIDRLVFAGLYRLAPGVMDALKVVRQPRYIVRDRDAVYGDVFIRRLRAMGIRDRPTAARSPWQNGYCERAIGSIRRECLDHVVVFGERHLRHLLRSYTTYYNRASEHPSVYVVEEKRLC